MLPRPKMVTSCPPHERSRHPRRCRGPLHNYFEVRQQQCVGRPKKRRDGCTAECHKNVLVQKCHQTTTWKCAQHKRQKVNTSEFRRALALSHTLSPSRWRFSRQMYTSAGLSQIRTVSELLVQSRAMNYPYRSCRTYRPKSCGPPKKTIEPKNTPHLLEGGRGWMKISAKFVMKKHNRSSTGIQLNANKAVSLGIHGRNSILFSNLFRTPGG